MAAKKREIPNYIISADGKNPLLTEDGKLQIDYKEITGADVLKYVLKSDVSDELKFKYGSLYNKEKKRESGVEVKKEFLTDYSGQIAFVNAPKGRKKMTEEEKKAKAKERAELKKMREEQELQDVIDALLGKR